MPVNADDEEETLAGDEGRFDTTLEAASAVEAIDRGFTLFAVYPQEAEPIALRDSVTLFGRAVPRGGIRLSDRLSSRTHASLVLDKRGVTLKNHSVKNGSFLNGVRVEESPISDGGVLRFGDSLFILRATTAESLEDAEANGVLGPSCAARALRRQIALVAPTEAWVMLIGETGAGKEVVARALHEHSGRRGALVAVNCGGVPAELAESQFFGHKKGAFTGADRDTEGFFQAANGGTLFLDELGELPAAMQAKLLRALDERAVARIGDRQPTPVDVRVIAATNRDLTAAMNAGDFRTDLYARLADLTIELPALRERREDVLFLLRHFLDDDRPLAADLAERLVLHSWPFNVRELRKVAVELGVRAQQDDHYRLEHVARRLEFAEAVGETPSPLPPSIAEDAAEEPTKTGTGGRTAPTRVEVEALLIEHEGNLVEVARAAGRSRKQVYRWLDKYGLDADGYRRG